MNRLIIRGMKDKQQNRKIYRWRDRLKNQMDKRIDRQIDEELNR